MVLTAAHVVGNAEEIMVQLFDGQAVPAKTVRISKIADVAVIQLLKPLKNPQIATMRVSDDTRIGDKVFVIGAPMGLPYSLSRGVISGRHSEENKTYAGKILEFFQTDAAMIPAFGLHAPKLFLFRILIEDLLDRHSIQNLQ